MIQLLDYQAIIFDMDGTLIDSETVSRRAFHAACEQLNLTVAPHIYESIIGLDRPAIKASFLAQCGADFPYDEMFMIWNTIRTREGLEQGVAVKAGARALLHEIHRLEIPMAIATSTNSDFALKKLNKSGLIVFFETIVTGDQVTNGKPAPDSYLLAAQRLGVDPRRCLAFEDSPNGVRAAVAAGMTVVQVPDVVAVTPELRALGHTIVDSLVTILAMPHTL